MPVRLGDGLRVADIQRARLLRGAVAAIEEHGFAGATVAHITTRARVSRRTFYELFENRDACLAALIEHVVGLIEGELAAADLAGLPWRERTRDGLAVILSFLDREPALARVCVVQALRGGTSVLESREAVLGRLAAALDRGRLESARAAQCPALTAEGLVGATFGIVYARLLRHDGEPLIGLLGELMSLIALPYLGAAAARREQSQTDDRSRLSSRAGTPPALAASPDPMAGLPMRLTYRTARVLGCIAERPDVSNRAVADHAGISDQGQISKLLARLERLGLIQNNGTGRKGEPNAWRLTPTGEQVAQHVCERPRHYASAAR
jgi:AcrR family transcriptional regulator/DNA-binding MarR family transcriptional regulator